MARLEVLHPGALTTVQDLGRPGLAHLGIPCSGAADRESLRLANRLVGNPEDAACLETTLVGPRLRLLDQCTVALTGALVEATADGRPLAMNAPTKLPAGTVLELGSASVGLRTYVAFRGGIVCEQWFGSSSADLLTGLGPPPLAAGQELQVGEEAPEYPNVAVAPVPAPEATARLELVRGPRSDCFSPAAFEALLSLEFRVSTDSNRIGVRLEGPPLERVGGHDLRSEGIAHGSLQVPPSGQPILLMPDHPTTGGYPVIAVVRSSHLAAAGQLRPGQPVRFFDTRR